MINDSIHDNPLLAVLDSAREYYCYHFSISDMAREYAESRGLTTETIKRFSIGFSPTGATQTLAQSRNKVWQARTQRTLSNTKSPEQLNQMIESILEINGLVSCNEQTELKDRFRGRLMIPINDEQGRCVSFGGRKLREDSFGPKYLNGSDSPFFSKHKLLFGLDLLHQRVNSVSLSPNGKPYEKISVLEGYMDVISLNQFGIEDTVATMGTSISAYQLEMLYELTDRVVLCFDGDEAGIKAAQRAALNARECLSDRRELEIVFLPDNHDPDSIIRQFDRESETEGVKASVRMNQLLDSGLDIEEYLIELIANTYDIDWQSEPNLMCAHLMSHIQKMPPDSMVSQKLKQQAKIMINHALIAESDDNHEMLVDSFQSMRQS